MTGSSIPLRLATEASRLVEWASSTFGNIKKKIRDAEKRSKHAHSRVPDADMFEQCDSIARQLDKHQLVESYWHARARVN